MSRFQERIALLLLLILGLAPRLWIVSAFPTIPVSDFRSLVDFGLDLRHHGLTHPGWYWEYLNPGLPLALSVLFRLIPAANPDHLARLATACATGLLPLLPFFLWRGVLAFWVRLLAAAALALWPGQILFTGTIAQDNWVLLPSVALGALTVRCLVSRRPAPPLIAALLYVAAVAIRQEMLVALLPLFLAATLVDFHRPGWRRASVIALAAGIPLLTLAAYRYASTGRFTLSSEEAGVAILSSYIPGANAAAYAEPYSYVASVRPDLLRDHKSFFPYAAQLAVQEALRRPAFHLVRIVSWACTFAVTGEIRSLGWSLGDDVLPEPLRPRAATLLALAQRPVIYELTGIHGMFLAAILIAIRRKNTAILVLAAAVLFKYGLHVVTAAQGRYFYPATALEILGIAVAAHQAWSLYGSPERGWLLRSLAIGVAFSMGLLLVAPRLNAFVQRRDTDYQRTYRFQLQPQFNCVVDHGSLNLLDFPWSATLRTLQQDPAPGDIATAACELTGSGTPHPFLLRLLDPYVPGGFPGRMRQRVAVDGVEVYSHDVAEAPGGGWTNIPLGNVGSGITRKVLIEVDALNPEPGAAWGEAARTTFRIAEISMPHLASGKPATQSSTFAGYASSAASSAVDGNTDGDFANGSVTHTNIETNPWWQVDLGSPVSIGSIVIWNRTDCCSERLNDYWVFVSNTPFLPDDTSATLQTRPGTWASHLNGIPQPSRRIPTPGVVGRYIRVQLDGKNPLSLAEVQVLSP